MDDSENDKINIKDIDDDDSFGSLEASTKSNNMGIYDAYSIEEDNIVLTSTSKEDLPSE